MSAPPRTARTAIRSRVDVGALRSALAGPGADTRSWIVTAIVTELGYDPDNGPFVDLQFQTSGQPETALVGSCYAGAEFGDWCPIDVGDTVLVAIPGGDPGEGPIVLGRVWNAGDKPFAEMGDGEVMSANRVIRVRTDKNFQVVVNGEGKIELTKAGAEQSFVRGDDQKSALDDLVDAMKTWAVLVQTGVTAGGGSLDNTNFNLAITAFKQAIGNALSTKIKGE